MTPPPTFVSVVMDSRWLRTPWRRRLTFAALAIILAVFCVWPRYYLAEAELLPEDSGGGLSAVLAQQAGGAILNLGALTGNKQSIEADLTIARSHAVLVKAQDKLRRQFPKRFGDARADEVTLKRRMGIVAIRGSIVQITVHDPDPMFAKALVSAVASAIQDRLADISIEQALQKRAVAENRLKDASARLYNAQQALAQFRLANRLPAPEVQLGAAVSGLSSLEAQLQAKQVELTGLQQVATPDSLRVKVAESELEDLQRQIAKAQGSATAPGTPTLAELSTTNAAYNNLYRDEKAADLLYQVYTRYLEEVNIDELSAYENLDVIEPGYVIPNRQYNLLPEALLALVLLMAVTAEIYVLRPPVGRR